MSWWAGLDAPAGLVTIIGCGHRKWDDCGTVASVLEPLRAQFPLLTVIEGGAPGADQCCARWAAGQRSRGVTWTHVPARWDDYAPHERWQAGHDRNAAMCAMAEAARDDRHHGIGTVAFKVGLDPRLFGPHPERANGGTEDMIRRSWAARLPVWHVYAERHAPKLLEPTLSLEM